jgi:ring-1,2-phenylacetyl-CoA epoxidase subunit PaaE
MVQFHPLTVTDVRQETPDTVSIAFHVPDELKPDYRFQHGQYLTLRTKISGEEVRRSYSICSAIDEPELRVAVKKVPGGRFSTFANTRLKPGDSLDVMTPNGRFTAPLDGDVAKTYVAFAAGSGITPVMSIVKTVLKHEPSSQVVLFYGNRNTASIIFREQLQDLKNRYLGRFAVFNILSRENQEIDLLTGRLDDEKVRTLLSTFCSVERIDEAFVCGPNTMIDNVASALEDMDVPRERIHFERFTSGAGADGGEAAQRARERVEASGEESFIRISVDGAITEFTMPFDGETILDGAIRAGADVPFSCKGGMCCTCRSKVVKGKVDMAVNYALEDDEVAAGFTLTCQSRPLTDQVEIDFDVT